MLPGKNAVTGFLGTHFFPIMILSKWSLASPYIYIHYGQWSYYNSYYNCCNFLSQLMINYMEIYRLISKSNYQCRKLVVVRFSNSSSVDSVGEPDFPMILNRSSSVQCVPSVTSAERTTSSSDSTFSTPAVNKFDPVFTKSSSQEYRSARSFLSHPIGTTSKICIKEIWFLNNMRKKTVLSELNVHGLLLFQCNTWLEEWGQSQSKYTQSFNLGDHSRAMWALIGSILWAKLMTS